MAIERKLAAIMFTDIAGYTALSAKDSTKASELLKIQRDTLKPIVEKHGGSWMKEMGDGLLLTFDSATSAVECSISIQQATKDIEDLNLRIGIHEGEVIKQDGDVIGDDVNVASRIEPFSAIGGVAISQKIQQAISSNQEFETKYIGKPKLKGVSQEVKVYCITSHGLPETDVSKVSAKLEEESKFNIFAITGGILTAIGIAFWIAVGVFDVSFGGKAEVPSVGILMMENLGKEDDEFWTRGITEDLIVKVAGAGLIRVAPMKEILEVDIKESFDEIAKKLRVKYLLTSSLHKKEDGFDLRCQLIETKSGNSKYANKWSEPIDNAPTIVGNLADNILKSLGVTTKQKITKVPTTNSEAYEYYLKAKYKWDKRLNLEDKEIVRRLLHKSIELDDKLLASKILLGRTYLFGISIYHGFDETVDNEKAKEIFNNVVLESQVIGDKMWEGRAYRNIGIIYSRLNDYDMALDYTIKALEISESIDDKVGMAHSINNIGLIYVDKTDYNKALSNYSRSLAIYKEIDDKKWMILSLYNIAFLYELQDEYDKSLDKYTHSLNIAEQIGEKMEMGYIHKSMANIYYIKEDYDKSLDYYTRSMKIFEELGDKRGMGYTLNRIGNVYAVKGDYDKALDYADRSLKILEELGDKHGMGHSLEIIGDIYLNKGNYDKVLEYYALSLQIREELGEKHKMGNSLSNIGWTYYEIGDYDKALDYYNRALKIYEELGWENISNEINNIGLVYYQQEDYNKAIEYLDKSAIMQMDLDSTITLETESYLLLSKKILAKEYNVSEIHTLIKEQEEIEDYINFALFKLLLDTSYLETAYNQIQEKANNLEPDVAAKFLSYPIPKAIVEEWEKVK